MTAAAAHTALTASLAGRPSAQALGVTMGAAAAPPHFHLRNETIAKPASKLVLQPALRPVLVICGVSGCGKSAVGKSLSEALRCPFYDGDDLHPAANVAKMAAGTPLSDEDRWPWLDAIGAVMRTHATRNECAVIACSALMAKYRARLGECAALEGASVQMILLDVPEQLLQERLERRAQQGLHFMPPTLLRSQLLTLERPALCAFVTSWDPSRGWFLAAAAGKTGTHMQGQADGYVDRLLLHVVADDKSGAFPSVADCVQLVQGALDGTTKQQ